MCGGRDSILGVEKERAIERLRTGLPVRFQNDPEQIELCGVLLVFGKTPGKVERIDGSGPLTKNGKTGTKIPAALPAAGFFRFLRMFTKLR